MTEELVVLLSPDGQAIGTAPKASVHHAQTPLHLAFSAYVFNERGELLLTQRAHDKATFPSVWTNSACGHPGPGERLGDAVRRRVATELGLAVTDLRVVLPRFAYRAELDGVVEWELCPVLVGRVDGDPSPHPAEVADVGWVDWAQFADEVLEGRREVSVWCGEQVAELVRLGSDPEAWPTADPAELPPALPRD
ncbi:isopentenyl-diphosphate Delta-isomerase [Intrasporangium calvum]|uniref:Isopentenyl-diphosphate Delta-isomerase n=1 Tax=Intrasporangium calvum TaxID=53358 RepID=A0ABT5GLQ0_9MICO|nr:isopentenyl-diphosphate Delta-isomerase [Intrasporangium calvum]MDC5699139.1 isopentenyl-diphosphate Delta-isomerase [Intrasporangium calvum]